MLDKLCSHVVRALPFVLKTPLGLVPFAVKRQVLEQLMKWQLGQAQIDGELDFLDDRWLHISVRDLGLSWCTSLQNGQLVVRETAPIDVSFSADAGDLLMIATRIQDPDTLFFQRRLTIEGDTELGLHFKNLMDTIELDAMPKPLRIMLFQLADFVEAGLKAVPSGVNTLTGKLC